MKLLRILAALVCLSSLAQAQTFAPMQWGVKKTTSPYDFGALLGGTWRPLGTLSSGGVWSIPSSNLTFAQSGTGAGSSTVEARLRNFLIATDFSGVDKTGVADSTTGLSNAFAQMVATGKTLWFPCGSYKLSGSGSQVFLATNAPISMVAENKNCVTLNVASVGASTDVIHQNLTSTVYGTLIDGFTISGGGARAHYRLDVGTTGFLYFATITNNTFVANDTNGPAISLNAGSSAPGGAMAYSLIAHNNMTSFYCAYCGDNISFVGNITGGARTGVEISFVSGAANFVADRNIMANDKGMFLFHNGVHPKIINNELEAVGADTSVNGALVDFAGDTSTILGGTFYGNLVSVLAGAGNPGPDIIRVNLAERITIDQNRLSLYQHGGYHLRTTASVTKPPVVGSGNRYETITGSYSNPWVYNGGGWYQGCAPVFTAPTTTQALFGDPDFGCGQFRDIASTDLPTIYTNLKNMISATAPTIGSGFCTSPSISATNGTAAFQITVGSTCSAGNGVINMPSSPVGNGWVCDFVDASNAATHVIAQTGGTATTVVVQDYSRTTGATQNMNAGDFIRAKCTAF